MEVAGFNDGPLGDDLGRFTKAGRGARGVVGFVLGWTAVAVVPLVAVAEGLFVMLARCCMLARCDCWETR